MMSAVSFLSVGQERTVSRCWKGACTLALLAFLLAGRTAAAQTTQTVSLDAGWNLMSLHVQPDDSSFASIFDGAVSMVKNEDGDVYLPGQEIEQISTWRSDEGYKVYAETATTLNVSGSGVPLGATAIELDEGWNVIPYLPVDTQAVEKALAFIEESLVVVEDEHGTQYAPTASSSPLDSLRPGEGYKVYVDRADTLRYPRVVQTLDEALALTSVEVGDYVRVRGYHEPGDGGGGLFRVTDSGVATDGGTVFVFDADVSAEQTVNGSVSYSARGTSLPDSNLVWGTVTVDAPNWPKTADEKYLPGHTDRGNGGGQIQYVDYKNGKIGGAKLSESDNTTRYKYATSDRRLERVGVTNAVSIDWWGAKEADPNNPVNNWWRLTTALNAAAKIQQNTSYEWVYVDIPGEYYYRNTIRIREGTKLRGASSRYDDKPTQTFGQANGQPTYGKLTMMPGRALYHLKQDFVNNQQDYMTYQMGVNVKNIMHEREAEKFGMESLEIDGNIPNNTEPFEDPNNEYVDQGTLEIKLQQSATWAGFAGDGGETGRAEDAAEFNDLYIHDMVAGSIVVGNKFDFTGSSNLRLGDSARNHTLYRTLGSMTDVKIFGGGWASIMKVNGGSYANIDFDLSPTTDVVHDNWGITWKRVFDHHGKGFDLDWVNDSERISNMKVQVDNYTVNLPDNARTNPDVFPMRGYGGTFTNGTAETTPNTTTSLFSGIPTGGNGPIREYTIDGLDVTNRGDKLKLLGGFAPLDGIVLKDWTITPASGAGANFKILFDLDQNAPSEYEEVSTEGNRPIGHASRIEGKNIDIQQQQDKVLVRVDPGGETNPFPVNLFLSSLTVDNTFHLFMDRSRGNRGLIREASRVYMNGGTFRVPDAQGAGKAKSTHRWLLDDEKTIRLRNCTSQRGRESDMSGTYTSGASDEGNSFVLISTDLMSLAQEKTATVTSGNRTVQSVENADENGNVQTWDEDNPISDPRDPYLRVNLDAPIQSGNTITLDWTARVTPTADYQTTGVHIARPVANQSYTSGNGPFTIDLRGVAFSQETDAPIQYSASSGNTSVVTATVNSYEDPNGNQVPWELELTEQSAGTATITVDAEISGVGTAQMTFEVTVE